MVLLKMKMPIWKRILVVLWALWSLFCIAIAVFYFWVGHGFTQERVDQLLHEAEGCRDPIRINDTLAGYQWELDVCLDTNRWDEHKLSIGDQDPALWYASRARRCKRLVDQFSDPDWCEAQARRYEAAALHHRQKELTPLFAGLLAFAIILSLAPLLPYGIIAFFVQRFRRGKREQNKMPPFRLNVKP